MHYSPLINILLSIIFLIIPHTIMGLELCETSFDDENVRYIINLCRTRLNINSLKCTYTSIWIITDLQKKLLEKKGLSTSNIPSNLDFDFIFQNGNFVKIHHSTLKEKTEEVIEKPNNLLELLVQKFNPHQKKSIGQSQQIVQDLHYYYKGTLKIRKWYFRDNFGRYIYWQSAPDNFDDFSVFLDPRICLGYCKEKEPRGNTWPSGLSFYLNDFLNKPGKFYFYNYNDYKVLWHESTYENSLTNSSEPVSIEIWIDTNENICKISYTFFPTRIIHKKEVKELIGENVNCNYPNITFWEYRFYDYKEYENGIRIPMKTTISQYIFNEENPSALGIRAKYFDEFEKTGKIDNLRFLTDLSKCEDATFFSDQTEILIHPESVVINEPILEETFIAPEPDIPLFKSPEEAEEFQKKIAEEWTRKNNSHKENNFTIPSIIFIASCVIITLAGMFITKRYFGWGT
ncbi:MAG: hypothetical protein N2169_07440 [bacterium]|nr:hypothetical protein [bacterium]